MPKKKTNVTVQHEDTPPVPRHAGAEWAPFTNLRNEIDRLFDDFGAGFWRFSFPERMRTLWPSTVEWPVCPAIDLKESEGEFRITAELPGMELGDVEVKVTDNSITIRGEKSEAHKEEKEDYLLSERRYGEFQRSLPLPTGVDHDKIAASFANGVLTVTLPKTAEAKEKERKVEVKAA
jgi:HSP20 family protein